MNADELKYILEKLNDYTDYLKVNDLVDLKMYKTETDAYKDRVKNKGPEFTKDYKNRVLYPKKSLIKFIEYQLDDL